MEKKYREASTGQNHSGALGKCCARGCLALWKLVNGRTKPQSIKSMDLGYCFLSLLFKAPSLFFSCVQCFFLGYVFGDTAFALPHDLVMVSVHLVVEWTS